MQTIMHRIMARTTLERAYAALATAEGIRNWWTTDATLDERVDGEGRFWFYDRTQYNGVRVDELIPSRRIAWEMNDSSIKPLIGTYVTFDLSQDGEMVTIDFAQSGFAKPDEVYAIFSSGWYLYLSSLRQYLETGEGHPHPYLDFARPHLWFQKNDLRSAKPAIDYGKAAS